jgi:uncharacterized membrane protein
MIPRPSLRLPVWAAFAIVLAAYLVRAFVLRDGDLRPDLPSDAIVAVIVVGGIGAVAWLRHSLDEGRETDTATRPSEQSDSQVERNDED